METGDIAVLNLYS